MSVKIRLYYERKETSVIEHELTPAQYADFQRKHKTAEDTDALGRWVAANCGEGKEVDCYGLEDHEITAIYNAFENETIQD